MLLAEAGGERQQGGGPGRGHHARLSHPSQGSSRALLQPGAVNLPINDQSVPISISAFTGAELDEAQMQNIYRIAELTPNLEVRYVLANSVPPSTSVRRHQ